MPTPTEIENIAISFGSQYGVDIRKIKEDSENLLESIRDNSQMGKYSTFPSSFVTCDIDHDCAVIPDLETIDYDDVAVEPNLFASRVEQNFDEASRYAEICLQIRRQYGEMAKARNDTRFKFEEFLRLDLVHQEEVKAGLYELPLGQATAEKNALDEAIRTLKSQISAIKALYTDNDDTKKSGVLSEKEEATFNEASGKIARYTANEEKDLVQNFSEVTTRRRTALDRATWEQSDLAAKGSLAQQSARLDAAITKEDYLKKDVGFRQHRTEISRQLAWLQVHEHSRKSSIVNYNTRLTNLKTLFENNFKFLVQRILVLREGLNIYYQIDTPALTTKRGELLDDIAVWLASAQDALSKHKRAQRVVVLTKATDSPIPISSGAEGDKRTFEVDFSVSGSDLPVGRHLLRGVSFEFLGQYNRPITLDIAAPMGATPFHNSSVLFGRIGPFTPGLDLKAQHSDLFWNGSPIGNWKIKGTLAAENKDIDALIIYLWLSYE